MSIFSNRVIRSARKATLEDQKNFVKAITMEAKELIRHYPGIVTGYVQSMGQAFVIVDIGGQSFDLSLHEGCSDIKSNFIWDNLDNSSKSLINTLNGRILELMKLHDAWSDLYSGSLAGEALKIDNKLTISTDW